MRNLFIAGLSFVFSVVFSTCLAQNILLTDSTQSFDDNYKRLHQLILYERMADSCKATLDYVGAAQYLEKAKSESDNIDGYRKPEIYSRLAQIYWHMGNDRRAMTLLQDALVYCENSNDTLNYAHILYNIGNIYLFWKEYENAFSHYKKALKIFRGSEQSDNLSAVHNNLGLYYKETGDYSAALAHFDTSYRLDTVSGYSVLSNIGNIYNIKGDYDKGLMYFQKAMKVMGNNITDNDVGVYMNNIGRVYALRNQYDSAFHFLNRAFDVAYLSKNNKLRVQVLRNLADASYFKGDYKEAFDYFKAFSDLNDSLFNSEKYRVINELSLIYNVEKKEQEILELKTREQLRVLQINKQRRRLIFLLALGISLLLLAVFFRRKNIAIRNAYDELVRRNIDFQQQEGRLLKRINELNAKLSSVSDSPQNTMPLDQNSGSNFIASATRNDLLNRLIILMEKDKIFEDKHLTIEKVSKMLNSNQKYISQIINEEYQQNFNQYVNSFRVKKAISLLSDINNNFTIEAISEISGFNSKSTFNNAFKKITGVTPSTFRTVVIRRNDIGRKE